jgi:hypothetical protein
MPAPTLTYYSYDDGSTVFSGEIVYNPTLDRIWMSYTFPTSGNDHLQQIGNGTSTGTIVASSALQATGYTFVGFTNVYDSDTDSAIFYSQYGGNKFLKVDATTAVVTPLSTFGYYTSHYNIYGAANKKYYAQRSSSIQIDVVNLTTGVSTNTGMTVPAGEVYFSSRMTFSDATTGWMTSEQYTANLLKYDLTTGALVATYPLPATIANCSKPLVYSPCTNSIYVGVSDVVNPRRIFRFDIATTTFTLVWTSVNDGNHFLWRNSSDSYPLLNYDIFRDLIWFDDPLDSAGFGEFGRIIAFDTGTDSQKYAWGSPTAPFTDPVFPDNSTAPWKFAIAPDSVWVSENNNGTFQQLLRISDLPPSTCGMGAPQQPRIFVTLP